MRFMGMSTNPLISVILCTHNPRIDYLRRTLDALQRQTLPFDKWEFLLIDNASKDPIAGAWDLSWHPFGRHVREDQIGLTTARLRGIQASNAGLLVFVDDDNVLAPDFLEIASNIIAMYPFVGTFGAGTIKPEFEVQPPSELIPRSGMLALRTVDSVVWSNNGEDFKSFPWGAGLCVTREVADRFQHLIAQFKVTSVIGRNGKQLFSGEDDIFSWAALDVGIGFGIFPELKITHLISEARLNRPYFLRLIRDHAFSHGILRYLRAEIRPQRIRHRDLVHMVLHGLKNGVFSMRCQWAVAQGQANAARFILEKKLAPIVFGNCPKAITSRWATRSLLRGLRVSRNRVAGASYSD